MPIGDIKLNAKLTHICWLPKNNGTKVPEIWRFIYADYSRHDSGLITRLNDFSKKEIKTLLPNW